MWCKSDDFGVLVTKRRLITRGCDTVLSVLTVFKTLTNGVRPSLNHGHTRRVLNGFVIKKDADLTPGLSSFDNS